MTELKILNRILTNGSPILFLGAGFSLGAKTFNLKEFPKGNELKIDLIKSLLGFSELDEEFNQLMKNSLSQVCDYIIIEKSQAHLTDYLVRYFKNSIPADFHYLVVKYPWKKIYTTNIDDIVETCYSSDHKTQLLVQNLRRRSTIDLRDKLEYLKIHGCVNNPSEGLTFSQDSYLETMRLNRDYRFSSLMEDLLTDNIIFLGSDYNEINIDFYLKMYEQSGYDSSKGKLIFINPLPSLLFKSRIKKLNGILIEWDTKTFLEYVSNFYQSKVISHDVLNIQKLKQYQFIRLKEIKDEILPIKDYESQLYFGTQPIWKDIYDEWDFINFELVDQLGGFRNTLRNDKSGVFAITGKALSGKSTSLFRLGVELQNEGFECWIFNGKYFNYFEFYKWIKTNHDTKQFCLLIDDASFFYKDIQRLVNLVPTSQQLLVITTSRIQSHLRMRYGLVNCEFSEFVIRPEIGDGFASEIVSKLDKKGYLGSLKKLSINDRISEVKLKNDVINILFDITHGTHFRERLNKGLTPILKAKNSTQSALYLIAIFDAIDLPTFPKTLISFLFASETKQIIENIDDYIKYDNNGDLSLRTGFYLKMILKSKTEAEIIYLIEQTIQLVSPHVDNNSKNYWNHILASLINEKQLRSKLNVSTTGIRNMLYRLKDDLSDVYQFWIQLGISEQRQKDFERALNHFRQAESISPNSYMVQNAIGRNFLKHANSLSNKTLADLMFQEGEIILLDLINNRDEFQVKAFSIHTYLYEKINFLEKFSIPVSRREVNRMLELLKKLIEKDPDDPNSVHLNNHFYKFLSKRNLVGTIRLTYKDSSFFNSLIKETDIDYDDILDSNLLNNV